MDKLLSDSAKTEISNKVMDILRAYHISNWQSEPYHQNQNPAEWRYRTIKSRTTKVLPMRLLGSNVGIGMNPDGFSSSLDLMKTEGALCSGEECSWDPSGNPEEILSSEGSEDAETHWTPRSFACLRSRLERKQI